jgi:hypothetical protein
MTRIVRRTWRVAAAACGGLLLAACSATPVTDTALTTNSSSSGSTDNAPGSGIFGRLLDSNSQPIVGATCQLVAADGTPLSEPVTTASDGSFEIPEPSGGVPSGATIRVTPLEGTPSTVPLHITGGQPNDLELHLDQEGSVQVNAVLQVPAGSPNVGGDPQIGPWQVTFTNGVSGAFSLSFDGPFNPQTHDLALVWRDGGSTWQVQRLSSANAASPVLNLGSQAATLAGQQIQVAVLTADPGTLASVTSFQNVSQLGSDARLSAPPLTIVVAISRKR